MVLTPLAVAAIVAGSLFTGSVATRNVDPTLSNVLLGASVGTIAGGGLGTVPGAIAGGVATGAVVGGTGGALVGAILPTEPRVKRR